MTFSKTELVYIVTGLRMIQDGNFKPSDRLEASMIINKIQMNLKAYENVRSREGAATVTKMKQVAGKRGYHVE